MTRTKIIQKKEQTMIATDKPTNNHLQKIITVTRIITVTETIVVMITAMIIITTMIVMKTYKEGKWK